ncbi:MAG: hypothetical protein ACREVL_14530 [Solimonas sp.]
MREFTDVLRDVNGGKFAEELTEALGELVASCTATGKSGSLSVTLKLKPGKGSTKVVTLDHDYSLKSPDFERPQQFFFVKDGNTLLSDNPDQKRLPFTEVLDRDTGEIRRVETAPAGEIRTVATA